MNTIRVGTLVLKPQVAAHASEMFAMLSDPALYELENAPPESQAFLERRFSLLESRVSPSGDEQWLNWVIRVQSGALAGYVQATIASDGTAQIAYELGRRFWRQRIGSTAVRAMLQELAERYGVRAVSATVKSRNYRSLAFLRSLEFGTGPPRGRSAVRAEPDELVMYKSLGTANNALPT